MRGHWWWGIPRGVHFHYEERFLNGDDGDDDKEVIVVNIWANGTIVGILEGNNISRLALVTIGMGTRILEEELSLITKFYVL